MTDLLIPDDSYVSVAEASRYHAIRSSAKVWSALSEEDQARRLVSASDFLDFNYRFLGVKAEPNQPREFPRKNMGGTDSDGIPTVVKIAVFELALHENLNQNPEQEMESVRVGPIAVNYAKSSKTSGAINRFGYVASLLDLFIDKRSGSVGSAAILRG